MSNLIWLKVPNKSELYYLEYNNFKGIFRAINGYDLLYLEETDFYLGSSTAVYNLIKRLVISSEQNLLDCELEDFTKILKVIFKNLIEKSLLKPEVWFELIFIAGGKKFEPDWEKWLDTPIPILLGMSNIAKKYLQSF